MSGGPEGLAWWRLEAVIECRRSVPGAQSNVLEVLNALVKQARPAGADPKRAFHVPGLRLRRQQPPQTGRRYALQVMVVDPDPAVRAAWREAFLARTDDTAQSNFAVVEAGCFAPRSLATLAPCGPVVNDEVCLDFLSPLRFTPPSRGERLRLTEDAFLELLRHRLSRLFNREVELPVAADEIELLPYYWHYEEIRHRTRSQRGTLEYYNGCVGPLYLRGRIAPLLPWLRIAEELHLGGKLDVNPFGYFTLDTARRSWFEAALGDRRAMLETATEVLTRDDAAEELVSRLGSMAGASELADAALAQLDGVPEPAEAFRLTKRHGRGERIVERLTVREKTVQRRLLELLSPVVDRALRPSSVGYRKGRTREHAVERVRALIGEGYRYAVQSDIEDCFPSVDLARLEAALTRILPRADARMLELVKRRVRAPSVLDGEFVERRAGLAQGSPLSPMLANLYLDAFDAGIAGERGVLVRYADDFVILTRTRADAEAMLEDAEQRLAGLGLGGVVREIELDGGAAAAAERLLAPPVLTVTEPGAVLRRVGHCVEVWAGGRVVDHADLRRIGGLRLREDAFLSAGLVVLCQRAGIGVWLRSEDVEYEVVAARTVASRATAPVLVG